MSNTELIAGARKFLATPNLGRDMARELNKALAYMWELADIAEAAEARVKELEAGVEWEYAPAWDRRIPTSDRYSIDATDDSIVRRRKAGTWMPVNSGEWE